MSYAHAQMETDNVAILELCGRSKRNKKNQQ